MDASTSSPAKRRVLGELDPNASSSPKKIRHDMMKTGQKSPVGKPTSVAFPPPSPVTTRTPGSEIKKRSASPSEAITPQGNEGQASQEEPPAKRACLETPSQTLPESRAASPAPSSVFDNSALDHSQEASTLTEPDPVPVIQAPPPQPPSSAAVRPRLTREQARQRVETLRLRLGLANYKVRTNQTDVPLEQLERRVFHRPAAASFSSSLRPTVTFAPSPSFKPPSASFSSPGRPLYHGHNHQYEHQFQGHSDYQNPPPQQRPRQQLQQQRQSSPYQQRQGRDQQTLHHQRRSSQHEQYSLQQQQERQHLQAHGGVQQLAAAAAALIPVPVPVPVSKSSSPPVAVSKLPQLLPSSEEQEQEEEEEVVEEMELPRLMPPIVEAEPMAGRRMQEVEEEDDDDDEREEEEEEEE